MSILAGDHFGVSGLPTLPPALTDDEIRALSQDSAPLECSLANHAMFFAVIFHAP